MVARSNVNERWRMQRLKRKDEFPPFLSEVLMKKRWWQAGDLDPTHEVRYLCPSCADHGHWVIREDGTKALTRSVIRGTTQPVTKEVWYGLMEEMDPVEVRRRLRGKTPMRKMMNEVEGTGDLEGYAQEIIQQEMECLINENKDVAALVLDGVLRLCEFANNEAEDFEAQQKQILRS